MLGLVTALVFPVDNSAPGGTPALNLARDVKLTTVPNPLSVVASDVDESVLRTLAYSDLFDYPLTAGEIWRYQAGTDFSAAELDAALANHPALRRAVSHRDGYYCLRGREVVFDVRVERERASRPIWRRARLYARIVSRLPFVRMVAVTGALAMDNLGDRPDIDFMVVAEASRVWVCRRLIVGIVRLARLARDELCPNYIISDRTLTIDQRDLFTAHELAQMIPVYGRRVYEALLAHNAWAGEYLPVAFRQPPVLPEPKQRRLAARAGESILRLGIFDSWEAWEMKRMQSRLRPLIGDDAEVICSPEQCKGHTGRHRHWITASYNQQLAELGIAASER